MTTERFPLMTGSEYESARADRRAEVSAFSPVHLRAGTSFIAPFGMTYARWKAIDTVLIWHFGAACPCGRFCRGVSA